MIHLLELDRSIFRAERCPSPARAPRRTRAKTAFPRASGSSPVFRTRGNGQVADRRALAPSIAVRRLLQRRRDPCMAIDFKFPPEIDELRLTRLPDAARESSAPR